MDDHEAFVLAKRCSETSEALLQCRQLLRLAVQRLGGHMVMTSEDSEDASLLKLEIETLDDGDEREIDVRTGPRFPTI